MTDDAVKQFLSNIGRKGGKARVKKHGVEALRRMGRKGGKARAKKYDTKTLSKWAKKGGRLVRPGKEGK